MRALWTVTCLGALVGCFEPSAPTPLELRVMTFNVMCSFCGDGHFDDETYGDWAERLPELQEIIRSQNPDLVGLQELFYTRAGANQTDEVADLLGRSETYDALYYESREVFDYPDATILYRKARFRPIEQGVFWLSPTPDEPFSTGFDPGGQLSRLVYWAVFEEIESGRTLAFTTTHFDNNTPSQELSAPLLLERTAGLAADHPLIVTGDFNADLSDPAYAILTGASGDATHSLRNTFDGVSEPSVVGDSSAYAWDLRIDHIFVGGVGAEAVEVLDWTIDLSVYGAQARHASDHRAMAATLRLP
jgi:endonuclease/exonuclease/phosphatase family metal-dependent hydrolase